MRFRLRATMWMRLRLATWMALAPSLIGSAKAARILLAWRLSALVVVSQAGALIEPLHLSHGCCTVTGLETDASHSVGLGFMDFVRLLLAFFQGCLYVCCSSWRRPWWILALARAAGYHCRRMEICRATTLAAACVVAWDDATFGGWCHAANIASALVAPLFPPKSSKRGFNFKRENRRGAPRLL